MSLKQAIAELEEAIDKYEEKVGMAQSYGTSLKDKAQALLLALKSAEVGEVEAHYHSDPPMRLVTGTQFIIRGEVGKRLNGKSGTLYFSPAEPKE
jgi:hypothetical protein